MNKIFWIEKRFKVRILNYVLDRLIVSHKAIRDLIKVNLKFFTITIYNVLFTSGDQFLMLLFSYFLSSRAAIFLFCFKSKEGFG